jgi:hypothetical protein
MALIELNARLAVAYFTGRDTPNEILLQSCKGADCFFLTLKTGKRSKSKQASELVSSMCGVETAPRSPVHGLEQNGKCLRVSTHNTCVRRWAAKNAYGRIADAW